MKLIDIADILSTVSTRDSQALTLLNMLLNNYFRVMEIDRVSELYLLSSYADIRNVLNVVFDLVNDTKELVSVGYSNVANIIGETE